MFHLTEDEDVRALTRNVYDSFQDGGTFCPGFVTLSDAEANRVNRTRSVESDRYRVEQIKITSLTSEKGHHSAIYRYEITETREDLTVTIGNVERERKHDTSLVQEAFEKPGFSLVQIHDTDTPKAIINTRW